MKQYLDLLQAVLEKGTKKEDRTGTGTLGISGYQLRCDLQKGYPLLTTKKVYFKGVVHELLWFLSGNTNIKYLIDNKVNIWNDNAYAYTTNRLSKSLTKEEWEERIKNGDYSIADLGPVYGAQWRDWNNEGIDQINNAIRLLKTDPYSRRIIVSAWNPGKINEMALPPCHCFFQFVVREIEGQKYLDCILYQRSCDIFLGVPFNLASYSLLTMMMAKVVGMEPGEFIWTGGDVHLYLNHLNQTKEQLSREPKDLPQLEINYAGQTIDEFKYEDFKLINYNPHPSIKAEMAV